MRNIQEQENIDHEMGAASELQNAYARSQMNRTLSDRMPDDGRFHVIAEWIEYCPSTDAILGTAKKVVSSWDTREDAELECNHLSKDYFEDYSYSVYPPAKAKPLDLLSRPEEELNENTMPF